MHVVHVENVPRQLLVVNERDQCLTANRVKSVDVERLQLVGGVLQVVLGVSQFGLGFLFGDERIALRPAGQLPQLLQEQFVPLQVEGVLAERPHYGTDIRNGGLRLGKRPDLNGFRLRCRSWDCVSWLGLLQGYSVSGSSDFGLCPIASAGPPVILCPAPLCYSMLFCKTFAPRETRKLPKKSNFS